MSKVLRSHSWGLGNSLWNVYVTNEHRYVTFVIVIIPFFLLYFGQSIVFCMVFCKSLFGLFSFGHCIVCPSSTDLWLLVTSLVCSSFFLLPCVSVYIWPLYCLFFLGLTVSDYPLWCVHTFLYYILTFIYVSRISNTY